MGCVREVQVSTRSVQVSLIGTELADPLERVGCGSVSFGTQIHAMRP